MSQAVDSLPRTGARMPSLTRTIIISLTILLLSSLAPAQTGDWQAVKNLQPGTKISVQSGTRFHILCTFEYATDEQLLCERVLRGPRGPVIPPERTYARAKIREVRFEHSDGTNMATGALIGGTSVPRRGPASATGLSLAEAEHFCSGDRRTHGRRLQSRLSGCSR